MEQGKWSIGVGLMLVVAGTFVLLAEMGLSEVVRLIWPVLLAAVSVGFITVFLRRREHWWALIPGFVLAGLALVAVLDVVSPAVTSRWGGPLFLLFIAAAFGAVFAVDRAHWWALIPAGTMATLACIAALPPGFEGLPTAAVLFVGLALTFAGLALVPVEAAESGPPEARRMMWPLIPAAILGGLGLMFAVPALPGLVPLEFAPPVLLIGVGAALLLYAYRHAAVRPRRLPHLPAARRSL